MENTWPTDWVGLITTALTVKIEQGTFILNCQFPLNPTREKGPLSRRRQHAASH